MATVMMGSGWEQLFKELERELRALDPEVVLDGPLIDADGLPRFRARLAPPAREAGRKLLREYEQQAIRTCELCGHEGRVLAGAILSVRCPSCS